MGYKKVICPRSGEATERSYPTSKKWRLHRHRRAERTHSTFKVRRGGHEEIPLVQGKEQRLHFAGAAMKRYTSSKVGEPSKMVGAARGHQRADTLKPYSQKTSQPDQKDHSLV